MPSPKKDRSNAAVVEKAIRDLGVDPEKAYPSECVISSMDVKLPHLGEGADSGTVVTLFVKEGDLIYKDQPVLELENEKAVATIPATAAGKVTKIYVKPGDKIAVGQAILSVGRRRSGWRPAGCKAQAGR